MEDWIPNQPVSDASELGPLLILAIILIVGGIAGRIAHRMHVPAITGNILAGVLVGPSGFHLLEGIDVAETFEPLSTFAMGLIAVAVGGQLCYRRIHNALRRIATIAILESLVSIAAVFVVLRLLGAPWTVCVLVSIISAATAPATTVALIRETRAKGTFVKTLLSVVGLDNILCVVFFAFGMTLVADYYVAGQFSPGLGLKHVLWQLGGAILVGCSLGRATEVLGHRSHFLGWSDFSLVFVSVILGTGLGNLFQVSPLLTCLFYGVYLGNASTETERQIRALAPMEPLLFIAFFTIAGASLHLHTLSEVGLLCLGYVGARLAGKGVGAMIGGAISRSSRRIWTSMPFALAPQAGLAIGLVVLLESNPAIPLEIKEQVTVLILAAVTLNEIIGPLMTRYALRRAKEAGLDRPRLIEFVQEEYIVTKLKANDRWDAVEKLNQFLEKVHRLPSTCREQLRESIKERENQISTAIGKGVAIPHGRIEKGDDIKGVLGILDNPVDWNAPDGEPVRLVMLVATPDEQAHKHLEVLQCLAAMCSDDMVRNQLFAAEDPNEAWEIIENEETPNYNYFVEDVEEQTA